MYLCYRHAQRHSEPDKQLYFHVDEKGCMSGSFFALKSVGAQDNVQV